LNIIKNILVEVVALKARKEGLADASKEEKQRWTEDMYELCKGMIMGAAYKCVEHEETGYRSRKKRNAVKEAKRKPNVIKALQKDKRLTDEEREGQIHFLRLKMVRAECRREWKKWRWTKKADLTAEEYAEKERVRAKRDANVTDIIQHSRKLKGAELVKLTEQIFDPERRNVDLFAHINRVEQKNPEKLGIKKADGTYATTQEEFQQLIQGHWDKVYDKGHWPERPEMDFKGVKIEAEDIQSLQTKVVEVEITEALRSMKIGTSSGSSDVPVVFMKNSPEEWRELMAILVDTVFITGVWPEANKRLDVTMLHKKGSTADFNNYRTLGVGCNLCKTAARVMNNRMEKVVERVDLLTEMQMGFRRKRRAEENLFILDTIIGKRIRQRTDMNVALLDITKAYDRVDREILWKKLEADEWPPAWVAALKGMYEDTYGIVNFQGKFSKPCPLRIGLKQGCVLSPLLFAIYISGLSRQLIAAKAGPVIGEIQIPALFYADDMLLFGTDRDLQKLLNITGEFAVDHKIEFAGNKSMVLPFHRWPNQPKGAAKDAETQERRWHIGDKWLPNGEKLEVSMGEAEKGTYLGVTIQRQCGIYKPFLEAKIRKARSQVWLIKEATRGMTCPAGIAKKVWSAYGAPRVLYGLDIAVITQHQMDELQIQQNDVMRLAMRAPGWTKREVLHWETGILPIKEEVVNKRLQLARYIGMLPRGRWAGAALTEQEMWYAEDLENPANPKWKKYWLQKTIEYKQEYGIGQYHLATKERIKRRIRDVYDERCQREIVDSGWSRHLQDKGGIAVEEGLDTAADDWLWYRMREGILERQYLMTFAFDERSRDIRWNGKVAEWRGCYQRRFDQTKRQSQENAEREQKIAGTIQEVITGSQRTRDADGKIAGGQQACSQREEEGEDNGMRRVLSAENILDETISGGSESEAEAEQDNGVVTGVKGQKLDPEQVAAMMREPRMCLLCGHPDSLAHLLWDCAALAETFPPKYLAEFVEDCGQWGGDRGIPPCEWRATEWWLHRDRTAAERKRFGQFIRQRFVDRQARLVQAGIQIRSEEEMCYWQERQWQDRVCGEGPLHSPGRPRKDRTGPPEGSDDTATTTRVEPGQGALTTPRALLPGSPEDFRNPPLSGQNRTPLAGHERSGDSHSTSGQDRTPLPLRGFPEGSPTALGQDRTPLLPRQASEGSPTAIGQDRTTPMPPPRPLADVLRALQLLRIGMDVSVDNGSSVDE